MKHSHSGVKEKGGRGEHEAMVTYAEISVIRLLWKCRLWWAQEHTVYIIKLFWAMYVCDQMYTYVHTNTMTPMATVQVEYSLSVPFKYWILFAFTALAKQLPTLTQTFFHPQSHPSTPEHAHADPAPTVQPYSLHNCRRDTLQVAILLQCCTLRFHSDSYEVIPPSHLYASPTSGVSYSFGWPQWAFPKDQIQGLPILQYFASCASHHTGNTSQQL